MIKWIGDNYMMLSQDRRKNVEKHALPIRPLPNRISMIPVYKLNSPKLKSGIGCWARCGAALTDSAKMHESSSTYKEVSPSKLPHPSLYCIPSD